MSKHLAEVFNLLFEEEAKKNNTQITDQNIMKSHTWKTAIDLLISWHKAGTSTPLNTFLIGIMKHPEIKTEDKNAIIKTIPITDLPPLNGFYRSQTQGLLYIPNMNLVHLRNTIVKGLRNFYNGLNSKGLMYSDLTIKDPELIELINELKKRNESMSDNTSEPNKNSYMYLQ